MPRKDSLVAADWFTRAQEDLRAAKHLLGQSDLGRVVCYLLHQAVEKGLKGFLLARDTPLRRTHDVELLLEDATTVEPGLKEYQDLCADVADFHAEEKYPGALREPVEPEALEALLIQAEAFLEALERLSR